MSDAPSAAVDAWIASVCNNARVHVTRTIASLASEIRELEQTLTDSRDPEPLLARNRELEGQVRELEARIASLREALASEDERRNLRRRSDAEVVLASIEATIRSNRARALRETLTEAGEMLGLDVFSLTAAQIPEELRVRRPLTQVRRALEDRLAKASKEAFAWADHRARLEALEREGEALDSKLRAERQRLETQHEVDEAVLESLTKLSVNEANGLENELRRWKLQAEAERPWKLAKDIFAEQRVKEP